MAEDDGFLSRWSRRKAVARTGAPAVDAPEAPEAPEAASPAAPKSVAAWPAVPKEPMPVRSGVAEAGNAAGAPAERSPVAPAGPGAAAPAAEAGRPAEVPPPPTLADVAELTTDSDFRRFVRPDVDPGVRNAAMKKLFAAPEFNVMDGLDVYIDDYSRPSPLPASMLRKMAQTAFLGLVDPPAVAPAAPASDAAPAASPAAASEPPAPQTSGDGEPAGPAREDPVPSPTHEDTDLRLQPHDAPGPERAEPGAEPDPGGER